MDDQGMATLIQRLERAGYVIGAARPDADGTKVQIGEQWMTIAELTAVASQDSETEDKF